MANARFDDNHVPSLLGVLNSDGSTITPIQADPSTHAVLISDGTTGSDFGPAQAKFDDNHVPVMMAVSETDGITPVVVYANSLGGILVDST